ncbi:MAG: ATP-binding protein [Verrucomicrobiae bacterium]|nr:ATP-binding protein [Verrucomicrobiae bacterium]
MSEAPRTITFQVSPRLTEILGENYRSTEVALKELIDNAWDADASEVRIILPAPMTTEPIIVSDNGSGMKPTEVEQEYFSVARDRSISKGETTQRYRRKAKGRKGIGKFAGLMIADCMEVKTLAEKSRTILQLRRSDLLKHKGDLENYPVAVAVDEMDSLEKGTTITLTDLHQNLQFPNPAKLRVLLVREYGREEDFKVFVNGEQITFFDIPGEKFEHSVDLPSGGKATIKLTIAEGKGKIPQPGLTVRVNGKICGPSSHFGLETDEILPKKLVERAVGEIEIEADDESLVTADWGGLIESNNDTVALNQIVPEFLRTDLEVARTKEVNLAKARYQRLLNKRLEKLPEYRREFARKRLGRVFEMFFQENEERFDSIIGVVLDTFEKDEYWAVVEKLNEAKDSHVSDLADTLIEFGLIDTGVIGRQARARLDVLEHLTKLIGDDSTTEQTIHSILDANLWIFDDTGRLLSSNEGIRTIVDSYLNNKYKGKRANKRPDIIIAHDFQSRHLIIELKRPSLFVTRDHESQALKYRDDLQPQMEKIDILILGKGRAKGIDARNERDGVEVWSYAELLTKARRRIEWIINELKVDRIYQ